jgi:ABC-2 type transport system permease protein
MPRFLAVVKREFNEFVRSRMFVIGTLFGPVFYMALMTVPVLLMRDGAEQRRLAVVDASGAGIGAHAAALLAAPRGEEDARFHVEQVVPGEDAAATQAELQERIALRELDGYLWVPAGVLDGEPVRYDGRNATNMSELAAIRGAVQQSVQRERLTRSGIDPQAVSAALAPVPFQAHKVGRRTATGTPESMFFLAQILGLLVYLVVLLYGTAVLRGVMEEKKEKIAEVLLSSLRARDLIVGKVLGIGGAGLLQMLVWIGFAVLALTTGDRLIARFTGATVAMPAVPASVGVVLVVFFLGGFFLYAALFAGAAAIATTDQEAQQLIFPLMIPLMIGMFSMFAALSDPDGTVAVATSLIPFTSPVVMPVRAALTDLPASELLTSGGILFGAVLAVLWATAKIYRIGILSTGKRPGAAELWRWLRTA